MSLIVVSRYVPFTEPIDLLNVAFENPRKIHGQTDTNATKKGKLRKMPLDTPSTMGKEASYLVPDRCTGLGELAELRRLCPRRHWNFVRLDCSQAFAVGD